MARLDSYGGTLAWHLLLLLAVAVGYESLFLRHGLNPLDEGWPLYAAMQLQDGGVLYRDTFWVFPPGHLLGAWLGQALDPPGIIASRLVYASFNVALYVALYFVGRRLMPAPYALLGAVLLALATPLSHLNHYLFGYRYLVWSALALLCFARQLETQRIGWMWLAGALTGVALCFRITPAFAAAGALAIGVMAAERSPRRWLRDWLALGGGALVVAAPVALWLIGSVGLETVWREMFVRPVAMTQLQDHPLPSLWWPDWERRDDIMHALFALEFRAFTLLYVGFALTLALNWARAFRAHEPFRQTQLLVVVIWGGLYFTRAFGRSDSAHLDSTLPPICLLLAFLAHRAVGWLARALGSGRLSRAVSVSACALFFGVWLFGRGTDHFLSEAERGDRRFGLAEVELFVPSVTPPELEHRVKQIRKFTKPEDRLLDLAVVPLVHVLAGRRGVGVADVIMPGTFLNEAEELAFLERVAENPPAAVLRASQPFDSRSDRSIAITAPRVTEFVRERYDDVDDRGRWIMMRPRLGADGAPQEGFGAPARLPNLILIVIDALRPDHLGAYGYERPTSPNIDALAERGWRFRFAMAPSSWTLPSIGALFTSLHPSEHRGVSVEHRVRADVPTLAGLLRAAGYQTVGVTASFMHMSEDSGVARGFDSWSSPSIGLGDERGGSVSSAGQSDDRHSRALTGQELNVEVFDRLPKPRSQPLFLFVHYMDPHAPYAPGEPHRSVFARDRAVHDLRGVAEDDYLVDLANGSSDASYDERRWLVDLYDAEIAQVDAAVGSLIDELEQRGWLEESVIALVADHGEELGEHGGWLHGRTLQRESLFVPMIFVDTRRPGARGRRLERVDLLDVPTTLLAAAGVAPGRHMRGRRLLTEWEILPRGLVAQLHADPFSESSAAPRSQRFALTAWPWRSILRADGSLAIYDLRTDPMESAPMGRNQSKELRRVTAATDRIVGRLAPRRAAPPRAPVDSTPAEAPRAE